MITTRNDEGGIVAQDVGSHEQSGETLVLLKILALGNHQVEQSRVTPARLALKKVRESRKGRPRRPIGGRTSETTDQLVLGNMPE